MHHGRAIGAHLGPVHQHRSRKVQHQPRPAGPEHAGPQAGDSAFVLRHACDPGPVHLAEIHDQPCRLIQHPHPPRHWLAERQRHIHPACAVQNMAGLRVQTGQSGQILRLNARGAQPQQDRQKPHHLPPRCDM